MAPNLLQGIATTTITVLLLAPLQGMPQQPQAQNAKGPCTGRIIHTWAPVKQHQHEGG